jgi:hypothetical protein
LNESLDAGSPIEVPGTRPRHDRRSILRLHPLTMKSM